MKRLLSFLLICSSMFVYGQRTPDIGFQISTNNDTKLVVEYRLPFLEKWTFNSGIAFGFYSDWPSSGRITEATDTSVTERRYSFSSNNGALRFGVERQLKSTMFSLGADFSLGYRNLQSSYNNKYIDLNGGNNEIIVHSFSTYSDPEYAQTTRHYVVPRFLLSGKMDIPVGNRFFLNLYLQGTLSSDVRIAQTNTIDPLNEFNAPDFFSINFDVAAGIGLRYRFGTGKQSKTED